MDLAIEVKNLCHSYGHDLVYEDLNFTVEEGRILGLLGKNGSGKSTTINILNGFLKPLAGEAMIYGEDTQSIKAKTKARIGFLMEGHIQYSFMNTSQIERFYKKCYPGWKSEPYWELMKKINLSPKHKISNMSCGQRSQVALGLILAQDADLLILDDFSMGLDPGYRRLFIDYLRDYAKSENKTIFATSHIIQDMERLIDDVLIINNKKVLAQQSLDHFMAKLRQYNVVLEEHDFQFPKKMDFIQNVEQTGKVAEIYTHVEMEELEKFMKNNGIAFSSCTRVDMTLEDAFIGLTGRY